MLWVNCIMSTADNLILFDLKRNFLYLSVPLCTLQFLLIYNKFLWFKFNALATVQGVWRCGGGGGAHVVRKMYYTGPWKLALIPLYNPLKSPMGAHVHKTTYGPLNNTALYIMLLMRVNQLFGTRLTDSMPFHSAQKSLDFQDPTPYHLPSWWICPHQKS